VQRLEVFDAMYSGAPRPSDVPEVNFWCSVDIYSDHMVRRYEQSFLPLERIDSTAFMIGNTGTIYYRRTNAWQGMLLLMVARGGWINTIHGNLEFLDEQQARWFAKVQAIYAPLQAMGRTKTFGGIPGEVQPYGFGSIDAVGSMYTVVNPAQSVQQIKQPLLSQVHDDVAFGRPQLLPVSAWSCVHDEQPAVLISRNLEPKAIATMECQPECGHLPERRGPVERLRNFQSPRPRVVPDQP
jgi:hypothetical protein